MPVRSGHGTCAVLFHSAPSLALIDYDLKKTASGKTRLYAVLEGDQSLVHDYRQSLVVLQNGKSRGEISNATAHVDLEPELWGSNVYDVALKSCSLTPSSDQGLNGSCTQKTIWTYTAEMGAADALVVRSNGSVDVVELIPANTISMLWQVPQYIVITVGEALFSITGLEFSYSEASPSMKSVLTAIWLLTTAFGNVIDMIISGSGMMKHNPAGEFFVYASLMAGVMLVFIVLAWRYKSVHDSDRRGSSTGSHLEPRSMKNHLSTKGVEVTEHN